jgi:hypothetical protein
MFSSRVQSTDKLVIGAVRRESSRLTARVRLERQVEGVAELVADKKAREGRGEEEAAAGGRGALCGVRRTQQVVRHLPEKRRGRGRGVVECRCEGEGEGEAWWDASVLAGRERAEGEGWRESSPPHVTWRESSLGFS